jgi:hypothetical protein
MAAARPWLLPKARASKRLVLHRSSGLPACFWVDRLNHYDSAIWRGVAEAVDRIREIRSRYRSGKGVWPATVDISRWDVTRRYAESSSGFHEKCNSKKEAEEAARRRLAEEVQFFSAEYSVEASVVCDLEWYEAG